MLYFPPFFSYEFKVKPRNELGSGPPSEPVTFNTESGTFLLNCLSLDNAQAKAVAVKLKLQDLSVTSNVLNNK